MFKGLEIPVDDTFLVRGFEALGNLECNVECGLYRHGAGGQKLRQRVAFDKLKNQKSSAIVFFKAVDGSNVRVVE